MLRRSLVVMLACCTTVGGALWGAVDGAPRPPAAHRVDQDHRGGLPRRVDYVALGDSYSSGAGIGAQRGDPVGCMRSTNDYPAYLAGYLGVTTYHDVTCSGATVGDLFYPQSDHTAGTAALPQLSALSPAIDLVTIGIGANQENLFYDLFFACPLVAGQDPTGHPCQSANSDAQRGDRLAAAAVGVRDAVAAGLQAVRQAAPNARVLLVGYPRVMPDHGTCPEAAMALGDQAWARSILLLLNRSLRQAARATGTEFVNLYVGSKGHDICAGPDQWVNGAQVRSTGSPWHPNQSGERHFARTLFTAITGHDAPVDHGDAAPPAGSVIPSS